MIRANVKNLERRTTSSGCGSMYLIIIAYTSPTLQVSLNKTDTRRMLRADEPTLGWWENVAMLK